MGTLRAWAWGASRALDYFERTNPWTAARRRGGHSRWGKTAVSPWRTTRVSRLPTIAPRAKTGTKITAAIGEKLVENIADTKELLDAGNFLSYAVTALERYARGCARADRPVRPPRCSAAPGTLAGGRMGGRHRHVPGGGWRRPVYKLLARKTWDWELPPVDALVDRDVAFRDIPAATPTCRTGRRSGVCRPLHEAPRQASSHR